MDTRDPTEGRWGGGGGLHKERSEVNEGDTKRHVQMRLDLRNGGCNGCS